MDGAHDLVASLVYRDADAYWAVSADRAEKQMTVWTVSANGELTPVLRASPSGDSEPAGFAGGGRFLTTVPKFSPGAGTAAVYALRIWAVGLDERLRLACSAAGGNLSAEDWSRYIGDFTGEMPRPTCEAPR